MSRLLSILFLATTALVLAPPPSPLASLPATQVQGGIETYVAPVAGSQPQMAGVDGRTGAWSTQITLDSLPSGGPTPELSLRWTQPGSDGLTGAGFRWAFDRRITRVSATGGAPRMDDTDVFVSGGRELVSIADGTWRLEDDPWTVFEATEAGWVSRRDGRKRTFAAVEHDCVGATCASARRWYLVHEEDAFGRGLDIVWEVPTWSGESTRLARPHQIVYQGGDHLVTFHWEVRPDVRRRVEAGELRTLAHRLAAVGVTAERDSGTHLAAWYVFSYRDDLTSDGRSLLAAVDQVEVVGKEQLGNETLTVAAFEYSGEESLSFAPWTELTFAGADPVPEHYDFSGDSNTSYTTRSRLLDVDGDALADLIQLNSACSPGGSGPPQDPAGAVDDDEGGWDSSPTANLEPMCAPTLSTCVTSHRVFVNLGSGHFAYDGDRSDALQQLMAPPGFSLGDDGIVEHVFADFDADGRVDLALGHIATPAFDSVAPDASEREYRVFLGAGSGWGASETFLGAGGQLGGLGLAWSLPVDEFAAGWMSDADTTRQVDLDGDGLADLVADGAVRWNLGTPTHSACDTDTCEGPYEGSEWQELVVLDASGDVVEVDDELPAGGSGDCMSADDGPRYLRSSVGVSSESFTALSGVMDPTRRVGPEQWLARHTRFTDLTGDGIADRLVLLRWPAADTMTRCDASGCYPRETWVRDDSCGGLARLYVGLGDGTFQEIEAGLAPPEQIGFTYEVETSNDVAWQYQSDISDLGVVDVDGDGRRELTRFCGGGDAVIADRGAGDGGFGLGSTACEQGRTGFAGHAGTSSGDGTLVATTDLDGDGFADRFHGFNVLGGGAIGWFSSHSQARWARNQATAAPGLLTAVTDATGHRTEVTWRRARAGAESWAGPSNPRVTDAVTTEAGTTTFSFSEPIIRDGRFVAFAEGRAEGTSGVAQVWSNSSSRVHNGQERYRAFLAPDGTLSRLHVDVMTSTGGAGAQRPWGAWVRRACDFDFARSATHTSAEVFRAECLALEPGSWAGSDDYEVAVKDTTRDPETGAITLLQDHGDPQVSEDDRLDVRRYWTVAGSAWDPELAGARVKRRWFEDSDGVRRDDLYMPRAHYVGPYWKRQSQYVAGEWRTRARAFEDGELSYQTDWGWKHRFDYTSDHCGLRRTATRFGVEERWERDALCRLETHKTPAGAVQTQTWDGFNRKLTTTVLPGHEQPSMQTLRRRDARLERSLELPSSVVARRAGVDDWILTKGFALPGGLVYRTTVCASAAGFDPVTSASAAVPSGGLDELFPCAEDDPSSGRYATHQITLYDPETASVLFKSAFFDARDGLLTVVDAGDWMPDVDFSPAAEIGVPPSAQPGWTHLPGSATAYDAFGLVWLTRDANGLVTEQRVDLDVTETVAGGVTLRVEADELVTTTRRNGDLVSEVTRNAFGEVVAETDAELHTTEYTYDEAGRRSSEIRPAVEVWTSCDTPVVDTPTTTFTYTLQDTVRTTTDPLGHVTTNHYDWRGRLKTITGPDGSVLERRSYVDHATRRAVWVFDAANSPSATWLDGLDRVIATRSSGDLATTSIEYDRLGRQALVTSPSGATVSRTFDSLGRVLTETTSWYQWPALQHATRTWIHDARGNVLVSTDADGTQVTNRYDAGARKLEQRLGTAQASRQIEAFTYDGEGRVDTRTLRGVVEKVTWDDLGRESAVYRGWDEAAAPQFLEVEGRSYTARDQVRLRTNGVDLATGTTYDALGRPAEHLRYNKKTGPEVIEQLGYDAAGRLVRRVDELGRVTCLDYDAMGREVSRSVPGQGVVQTTYTADPEDELAPGKPTRSQLVETSGPTGTSRAWIDGQGRTWRTQDALGVYVEHHYLPDGRPDYTARVTPDGEVAAVKLRLYYGQSDRVRADFDWMEPHQLEACRAKPNKCGVGHVRTTYTPAGRVETLRDAQGGVSTLSWSDEGQTLLQSVAMPVTTLRYRYDEDYPVRVGADAGPETDAVTSDFVWRRQLQLVSVLRTRGATNEAESITYTHDGVGRRTSAVLAGGPLDQEMTSWLEESRLRWTYDPQGRLETKSLSVDGVPVVAPGHDWSLRWTWGPGQQLTSLTYPSGEKVSYTWDAHGRLDGIWHGEAGIGPRLLGLSDYDDAGRPGRSEHLPDATGVALVVARDWDGPLEAARSASLATPGGVDKPLWTEVSGYDALGRLDQVARIDADGTTTGRAYGYDARDYLTSETYGSGALAVSTEHEYDKAGLRTARRSFVGQVLSDELVQTWRLGGRSRKVDGVDLGWAGWDAYGRQLVDHRGNTYVWGLANQLREVESATGELLTMRFDAEGQRVARRADGELEIYVSGPVSGQVLHHRNEDGSVWQDVVRTPGGGVVALLTPSGAVPFVSGRADTIQQLGSAWGDELRSHTAHGELVDGSETLSQLGFHQTWQLGRDGLRVAGVRVYDPETGRFLAPDPLAFGAATDLNDATDFYRYAHNNPVGMQDATGYRATGSSCASPLKGPGLPQESAEGLDNFDKHREAAKAEAAEDRAYFADYKRMKGAEAFFQKAMPGASLKSVRRAMRAYLIATHRHGRQQERFAADARRQSRTATRQMRRELRRARRRGETDRRWGSFVRDARDVAKQAGTDPSRTTVRAYAGYLIEKHLSPTVPAMESAAAPEAEQVESQGGWLLEGDGLACNCDFRSLGTPSAAVASPTETAAESEAGADDSSTPGPVGHAIQAAKIASPLTSLLDFEAVFYSGGKSYKLAMASPSWLKLAVDTRKPFGAALNRFLGPKGWDVLSRGLAFVAPQLGGTTRGFLHIPDVGGRRVVRGLSLPGAARYVRQHAAELSRTLDPSNAAHRKVLADANAMLGKTLVRLEAPWYAFGSLFSVASTVWGAYSAPVELWKISTRQHAERNARWDAALDQALESAEADHWRLPLDDYKRDALESAGLVE